MQQLTEAIKDGNRTVEKLTGDIKNSQSTLDRIKAQAKSLSDTTEEKSDKAVKDYLKLKAELQKECERVASTIQTEWQELDDKLDEIKRKTNSSTLTPYQKKDYPNEYNIVGSLIVIRNKKYQEDTTPIQCNSNDDLLTTYQLIVHVSRQYGIYITPLDLLTMWNTATSDIPPTCPYTETDFDTVLKYTNAYQSMSLAIATKLKVGVKFAPNFMAPKLAINEYTTDGYVMLYHLVKHVHPQLQRNKATKPMKPKFEGNVNQYILKYKNWLTYQKNRSQPHIYDDDELADDFLMAVKQDP